MFSNFLAERRRCRWQRGDRPFDRIVAKQRKLLDKRASLISQIQSLPGFENFLMAPATNTNRSAAACGPVIIVNHSECRCDIIILLHPLSQQQMTSVTARGV